MSSITLFGAGSWGTALSCHLAAAGRDVTLWVRRPDAAEKLRRTRYNPKYLQDLFLPASVQVTANVQTAAEAADLWGMAVPAPYLRDVAERIRPFVREGVTVASLAKGFERETLLSMSQVLNEVFDVLDRKQIGALYGPSHSEEVGHERLTTVVAAAPTVTSAQRIQNVFMTDNLRVYLNTDVIGVEIGGSMKNVLAIAAGISDGLGYGDNTKAAIVTRGLTEIRRLGLVMGAEPETFAGLTGIGDLTVTCTSRHSRNRYVGEQIGQGKSLSEIQDEMEMVAEGVYTAQAVHDLAEKHQLEMPLMKAIHTLLFDDRRPSEVVDQLMTRPPRQENWHLDHPQNASEQ